MNPLDQVTTVKGYSLLTGLQVRQINRLIKRGELQAKNEFGVWLVLIPSDRIDSHA